MCQFAGLNPESGPVLEQIRAILFKDFRVEFRQRVLTATLLLFVASSCFTVYQVYFIGRARVTPLVWNSVFWIMVLFSSFQVVGRTFSRELNQEFWYYTFVVKAELLILSKLIYHFLMLNVAALLVWIFLSTFFKNPVQDVGLFWITVELGCLGFSSALTLVSAIASKAGKNSVLLPVLGFPLLIPILIVVIRLSITALDTLDWGVAWQNIFTLCGLDAIMIGLSFILFPYLWRH